MNKRDLLRELVGRLHAEGTPTPDIYHEACALNEQLGRPVANANDLVREIVGPYTAPRPSQEQLSRDHRCWRPPESWRGKAGSGRDPTHRTPEQARKAKRDLQRAALWREGFELLRPTLLDSMLHEMAETIRHVAADAARQALAADLFDAIEYCLSKRKGP